MFTFNKKSGQALCTPICIGKIYVYQTLLLTIRGVLHHPDANNIHPNVRAVWFKEGDNSVCIKFLSVKVWKTVCVNVLGTNFLYKDWFFSLFEI